MNDEQVASLTREYAEETRKDILSFFPRPLPESMELLIKNDQVYYEKFLEWLLQRYCLVEKSKLEEEYKSNKHYFEHTDSSNLTQKQYFWGRMCAIESLFPEIAKEVEG